jgi:uncharacterized protein GlcG (DUF336 family)
MLHLDDATVATLLDLRSVTDAVADAFAAWGRGEAATTHRVRATSPDGMASAMAAVVPPYTGGKVYATVDGSFTFVNVLFDLSGRALCTLDGDVLTRFRTPAGSAIAIRHLAAPGARGGRRAAGCRRRWGRVEPLHPRPSRRPVSRFTGGHRMITQHRLSLEEAELAADAALAKAAELGVGSVVCVCDAAGWPLVVKRPDTGKPTSVEIAINKAFTAACHRRPTHTYTNAQPGQEAFGIMNMHGGRFAIFVGGWPIEVDGEVVGGIGVSGGHTKEDIACCQAGIASILERLGKPADFSKWDDWRPPAPTSA